MHHIPFQDLAVTDKELRPEIEREVLSVIRSGRYLHGPQVKAFERELSDALEAKHSVGVSNGLDALRLILTAYVEMGRLKPGDEVIIPGNTFIATFLSAVHSGLRPVVAEPSELDFNIDFERLPLTEKTRAIIPVHLFGTPAWNREAMERLKERHILVIEDNAQALGAETEETGFNGSRKTGNLGDASAISFYPAKNIGAMGDAGAVVSNDGELIETVRKLANYGSEKKYHHELRGFNCRMDEIQAAILRVKLRHLDEETKRRQKRAHLYDELIDNPLIRKPLIKEKGVQAWHQYVVRTPERDRLRKHLEENGIGTEIHYPVPAHLQPCFRDGLKLEGAYHTTEKLATEILSLPISNVTEKEIEHIANIINRY